MRPPAPRPPPAGRDLYKRNLALIKPFLEEPAIALRSLRRLPSAAQQAGGGGGLGIGSLLGSRRSSGGSGAVPVQLFAEWTLTCYVQLPWAPYVRVEGTTTYTLNGDSNQARGVGAGPFACCLQVQNGCVHITRVQLWPF